MTISDTREVHLGDTGEMGLGDTRVVDVGDTGELLSSLRVQEPCASYGVRLVIHVHLHSSCVYTCVHASYGGARTTRELWRCKNHARTRASYGGGHVYTRAQKV